VGFDLREKGVPTIDGSTCWLPEEAFAGLKNGKSIAPSSTASWR